MALPFSVHFCPLKAKLPCSVTQGAAKGSPHGLRALLVGAAVAFLSTAALAASTVTGITTAIATPGASANYNTTWLGAGLPTQGPPAGTPVNMIFSGEIRQLTSVTTAAGTHGFTRMVNGVVVYRNPVSPPAPAPPITLRFESANGSITTPLLLDAPYVTTTEAALLTGAINVSLDNTFVNTGNTVGQQSTVERIDFLWAPMVMSSAAQLTGMIIPVFDFSDGSTFDQIKIAALIGSAGSCAAPAVGNQVAGTFPSNVVTPLTDQHSVTTRFDSATGVMRPSANLAQGAVGLAFTPFELGVLVNDTLCGFAVFSPDSTGPNPLNAGQNPTNTGNAVGGVDLIAATGLLILPLPPVTSADTSTYTPGSSPNISVLANDSDPNNNIDATTVVFVSPPAGSTLAPGGKSLLVPGQGTWSIAASGVVTFAPVAGFVGNPTAVSYTVTDSTSLVSNASTITLSATAVAAAPVSVPMGPWQPLAALLGAWVWWSQRRRPHA